ncbi:MAG: hypothetical protein WA738_05000 [Candidatus Angelobacter sp.]
MKKYLIAAGCVGLVVALLAVAWYAIAFPAKEAARNLAAINGLSVGKTTEAELLSRKEFQKTQRMCFQETCLYHMKAENALLSKLHLAPPLLMGTTVRVRDGLVTDVVVFISRPGHPAISLHQVQTMPEGCAGSPCVKLMSPPNKTLLGIGITFDNGSDIRNRIPQAVNSECLSRLHGCANNAEFVPLVKQLKLEETPAGLMTLRD